MNAYFNASSYSPLAKDGVDVIHYLICAAHVWAILPPQCPSNTAAMAASESARLIFK